MVVDGKRIWPAWERSAHLTFASVAMYSMIVAAAGQVEVLVILAANAIAWCLYVWLLSKRCLRVSGDGLSVGRAWHRWSSVRRIEVDGDALVITFQDSSSLRLFGRHVVDVKAMARLLSSYANPEDSGSPLKSVDSDQPPSGSRT